jgi:hypothetical protein
MKIKSSVKAGFNPQPDPPGFQLRVAVSSFNPQPDPPGRR